MEQDNDVRAASGLARRARALEILTVVVVVLLLSPVSFVVSLPFHVAPETWLMLWLRYVFVFVILAIATASLGFGVASSYRVRARTIRKTMQGRG